VQGAFLAGARQIVAVDLLESKLAMARQLGASDLVNSGTDTVVEQIIEMTKGGVDHAFEAIGLTRTAEQAFASLRPNGTATVIGMIPPGRVVRLLGASLLASRRIQGSSMGSNRFRVDVPRYVDLYLQGRLKLDELVSSHITLDQLNEAFESVRAGEVVRYVLLFDQ
ncbi:MAG TPA: zinc-binding dehydrogenase, partial [Acidimicrobiales bacterium]|nr:zinc-binding dehydrogenase [Acidimicrobiales bacterium]